MKSNNYTKSVREQYESYPFPPRDPEEELTTIKITDIDFIGKISHYCFNGKLNPEKQKLRFLVAGGGTGDAVIFLAEQLRGFCGEVTYLDMSQTSMHIAQQRAKIRTLDNIQWIQGSLLDLQEMDIGEYDYINCYGVLHHLKDPSLGLQALASRLKSNGAMGLMMYAKYGRTNVYYMQKLLKMINSVEDTLATKVSNTRTIIDSLPETNWLKCGPIPFWGDAELHDSHIFDLFLHSQDQAYDVMKLCEWLDSNDIKLIDFAENKSLYKPSTFIKDQCLLKKINLMPLKKRQAIAENIAGNINKHIFYAKKSSNNKVASFDDVENIPYFCDGLPFEPNTKSLYEIVKNASPGSIVTINFPNTQKQVQVNISTYTKYFIKYIDSRTTIKKLLKLVQSDPDFRMAPPKKAQLLKDFEDMYTEFQEHDTIFLRYKNISPYKHYRQLQNIT